MNIAALQTFIAIVETGSLVRASEQLNVTQSTVTARLKSLEEVLGQPLIHRSKTGATCTSAGLRLQRYAQTISGMWRQARLEVSSPTGSRLFRNIAVHSDLWEGWGDRLFDAFNQGEEQSVSALAGSEAELADWLLSGLVDFALGFSPMTRPGFASALLGQDRLMLISTNAGAPIRFDPGYVYVDYGETFTRDHMEFYADANSARLTFNAPHLALSHLLAKGGTAYLPERLVQQGLKTERLHHLVDGPDFFLPVYLNHKEGEEAEVAAWPWAVP